MLKHHFDIGANVDQLCTLSAFNLHYPCYYNYPYEVTILETTPIGNMVWANDVCFLGTSTVTPQKTKI